MKRKQLLSLVLIAFTQACNPSSNNPLEEVQPPASVIASVIEKYPSARDIRYSVLESSKVYKADFQIDGKDISVVANQNDILNSFLSADQSLTSEFGNSLQSLAIRNGQVSNLRILETPGQDALQVANYNLGNVNYQLTTGNSGRINMTTRSLAYETKSLTDLPEKIQTFISQLSKPNPDYINSLPNLEEQPKRYLIDKNELTFELCRTYVLSDNQKQYEVNVKYFGITTLPLVFDNNADLVWTGSFNRLERFKNFDADPGGLSAIPQEDLAHFKNLFSSSNEYKDFVLSEPISDSNASLHLYKNAKGYLFYLTNPQSTGSESWTLMFDSNKKPVASYYTGNRKL